MATMDETYAGIGQPMRLLEELHQLGLSGMEERLRAGWRDKAVIEARLRDLGYRELAQRVPKLRRIVRGER